jgi:uncharacterized protein (DUF1697 family)
MARVVETLEGLGYDGVWTHANSGNVVFEAAGSRTAHERSIETALEKMVGFEVTTFVRTATELHKALELEPFRVAKGDTYFITFLKAAPSRSVAKALEDASNDFDTLVVRGRDVHWRMRGRSVETRLTAKTWNLVGHHGSTSRNTNLLRRLDAKLRS